MGGNNLESKLVQVMAWCLQATTITWANVDAGVCRHMVSLGHNELTQRGLVMPYDNIDLGEDWLR